jgi:hypothetical protein
MKERSAFAPPGDSDPDSFRDEKRVVRIATSISSGTPNFHVAEQELGVNHRQLFQSERHRFEVS